MKRSGFFSLALMIMAIAIISCKKDNTDPQPVKKKPYVWVAGDKDSTGYGMILFSADSGNTWVRQGQGTPALADIDVNNIWAVDEYNVWAVCSDNVILKTEDGGQIWNRVPAPVQNSKTWLSSISIVNKTNIWISGSGGSVWNSNDNGATWVVFDSAFFHQGLMQGIWAINQQKVYVVGGVPEDGNLIGFICFTLDGGSTWDTVVPTDDFNRHEWIGVVSSGNTIVVYGGKSHYVFSTDGGVTWKNDSVPGTGGVSGADINHLIMLNTMTWWGAFDLSEIFMTSNAGSSWTSQPANQNGEFLVGIDAYDSHLALTVGELAGWPPKGSIQKTSDGGKTWQLIHTYNTSLSKVSFIKP